MGRPTQSSLRILQNLYLPNWFNKNKLLRGRPTQSSLRILQNLYLPNWFNKNKLLRGRPTLSSLKIFQNWYPPNWFNKNKLLRGRLTLSSLKILQNWYPLNQFNKGEIILYVTPHLAKYIIRYLRNQFNKKNSFGTPPPKCKSIIFWYLLIGGTRINKWFHAQAYRRCCKMGTHPTPLVWEWELWEF